MVCPVCGRLGASGSDCADGFVEVQARQAVCPGAALRLADVGDGHDLVLFVGEESVVQGGSVEAGHRACGEAGGAFGKDEAR